MCVFALRFYYYSASAFVSVRNVKVADGEFLWLVCFRRREEATVLEHNTDGSHLHTTLTDRTFFYSSESPACLQSMLGSYGCGRHLAESKQIYVSEEE